MLSLTVKFLRPGLIDVDGAFDGTFPLSDIFRRKVLGRPPQHVYPDTHDSLSSISSVEFLGIAPYRRVAGLPITCSADQARPPWSSQSSEERQERRQGYTAADVDRPSPFMGSSRRLPVQLNPLFPQYLSLFFISSIVILGFAGLVLGMYPSDCNIINTTAS